MLQDRLATTAFGRAFGLLPMGMCIVDRRGRYVQVNERLAEMLGYTPQELVHRSFLDVTHPDDRNVDRRLSERLFRGEVPSFRLAKRWVKKDGGLLYGELSMALLEEEGESFGLALIQERAPEEASPGEEGGTPPHHFTRQVAHDLNNYLGIIQVAAMELSEELGQHADLRALSGAAERATALTRSVLYFGKDPGGEAPLGETVRASAQLLSRLLSEGVEFVLDLDPEPARVGLSASALDQVLLNLVVNARDAVGPKGRITVRTVADGDVVALVVQDNGAGIPVANQASVFEPLYTTKEEAGGQGLGLAIVRSAVEAAGGRVELASTPGQGTEVRLWLPRVDRPRSRR